MYDDITLVNIKGKKSEQVRANNKVIPLDELDSGSSEQAYTI